MTSHIVTALLLYLLVDCPHRNGSMRSGIRPSGTEPILCRDKSAAGPTLTDLSELSPAEKKGETLAAMHSEFECHMSIILQRSPNGL